MKWVVVATALTLAACSSDIQSGIDSANDLLYRKQYVASERLYYKLLKRLEDRGDLNDNEEQERLTILDRLGKINSLYLHDYAAALTYFDKLSSLYPKTEQAFAARAALADIYHHKLGKLENAVAEYQKLVAEFPDRTETRWAQLQISGAFFQLKDYEQARTEAETVINRWPQSSEAAQARFQIANSYYVQGRYAEAIATYERLLEGTPEPSLASLVLFELGNCFQELDDPDRALAYYYACLSDHPNPTLVQRKIRRVRTRMHRTKPSEEIALPEYVQKRLAVAQHGSAVPQRQRLHVDANAPEGVAFPNANGAEDGENMPMPAKRAPRAEAPVAEGATPPPPTVRHKKAPAPPADESAPAAPAPEPAAPPSEPPQGE